MSFVRLCRAEEVPEGAGRAFDVQGGPVAVFHLEDGFFAIDDTCTHEDDSLARGRIEGGAVICPWHGARFDIRTGRVLRLPATVPVRTYPVRVVDGWIEVGIDEERSDG